MKNILIPTLFFVLFVAWFQFEAKSQISTEERPISFDYNDDVFRTDNDNLKIMPSLDLEKLNAEDIEDKKNGILPRFGYSHKVDFNLENSGQWFDLYDGGKLWKLEIYCPNALSINLLYDKFWLPDGAKFFIYASHKKHTIGAFTSINNKKSTKEVPQGFATELLYGDKIVLEYYLPKGMTEAGIISVCNVIHGYRYVNFIEGYNDNKKIKINDSFQGFGDRNPCLANVNCPEGNNWQKEKNAIAFVIINGERIATGSLINNTKNDHEPLFLTHNLGYGGYNKDSKGDSVLSTWIFYWHYESPACATPITEPIGKTTQGATIVSNGQIGNNDFALLRLTDDPTHKQGVTPYYLGWDRSNITEYSAGGVCIYHFTHWVMNDYNDIKKIAIFNTINTYKNNADKWVTLWNEMQNGRRAMVYWAAGAPLLNMNGLFVGYCDGAGFKYDNNTDICTDPLDLIEGHTIYRKLSSVWLNNTTDPKRRLKDWLDPLNTGADTLGGLDDPCASNKTLSGTLATQTATGNNITMQNATIPSGAVVKVKACNIISVGPNVVVNTGATLELEAGGSVRIDYSTFKVMAGASFIIK